MGIVRVENKQQIKEGLVNNVDDVSEDSVGQEAVIDDATCPLFPSSNDSDRVIVDVDARVRILFVATELVQNPVRDAVLVLEELFMFFRGVVVVLCHVSGYRLGRRRRGLSERRVYYSIQFGGVIRMLSGGCGSNIVRSRVRTSCLIVSTTNSNLLRIHSRHPGRR